MSAEPLILVESPSPELALVTLNRPRVRNAVNLALLLELEATLDRLAAAPPRAMILRAAAPGFCAGVDLTESRGAPAEFAHRRVVVMHRALAKLRAFPAPVIAAVDGVCAGLGTELAISGDLRLATPRSRFGYPEVRVAVPSPAHHLTQLIGLARAQDMLLTGRWVGAEDAVAMGLVTRLAEDVEAAARELAEALARLAPRAVALTKENLRLSTRAGLEAAIGHHIAGVAAAAYTADRREALAAFAEKRPPRFTGT